MVPEHIPVLPEYVPVVPEHIPVVLEHIPVLPEHVPVVPEHIPVVLVLLRKPGQSSFVCLVVHVTQKPLYALHHRSLW